ncbi:MFS transporter [Paenibacillus sp. SYP-B3998]|uniref:MFS transporter n=1 Tax=Paenibacillus sp. SYP-B3998 TaxID=2678564 RepID=UPI001F07D358|nr:MFS transporter [Paenibacillus sp. SYP-B3998]
MNRRGDRQFSAVRLFLQAVYPALNALIVTSTQADFRGRAISLNQTSNQLGMMAGPLLGGILGGWIGIQLVFLITGVTLLGAAPVMKLLSSKRIDQTLPD